MTMTSINPLHAILQWLDSLRPDHRTILCITTLNYMPDIPPLHEGYPAPEESETLIRHWLSSYQSHGNSVAGKAVMFRSVVDFAMYNYFTAEGRAYTRAKQERFRHHLLAQGDQEFANKIGQSNQERDLLDAHWAKAAAAWDKLCKTDLSNEALNAYADAHPPSLF